MQMYDLITNLAASLGVTFDEACAFLLYFAFACVGGHVALVSLFLDLWCFVFRLARRLLRAALRPIRRRLKMHFQK